ncbi:MAG: hypothetical protein Q4F30_05935 [Akkermansia sp.]|nr:hypothetical protein [Akkermansia sp.]
MDFIDVKGPLLLYVYKVASQLAPGSVVGLYVLYSLAVASTLFFSFRTARVFLGEVPRAVLAAVLLLPFLYWYRIYCNGGQSEELMAPMFACLIYAWVRYLNYSGGVRFLACSIGAGLAATMLIKYNCAFVFGVSFWLLVGELAVHRCWKRLLVGVLPWAVGSFVVVFAPFVLYLVCAGILEACWRVYVELNFATYFGGSGSAGAVGMLTKVLTWVDKLVRGPEGLAGTLCLIGACWYSVRVYGVGWKSCMLAAVAAAGFVSCLGVFPYYWLFYMPCGILLTTMVMAGMRPGIGTRTVAAVVLLTMYAGVRVNDQWASRAPRRVTQKLPSALAAVESAVCSREHPRLLYLGMLDKGFGVRAGALPACPEWCTLNGVDETFMERQREAVRQRKADFVIVMSVPLWVSPEDRDEQESWRDRLCKENGYARVCSYTESGYAVCTLYEKVGE